MPPPPPLLVYNLLQQHTGVVDGRHRGWHLAHCCNTAHTGVAVDGWPVCNTHVFGHGVVSLAARVTPVAHSGKGMRQCSTSACTMNVHVHVQVQVHVHTEHVLIHGGDCWCRGEVWLFVCVRICVYACDACTPRR